jgi:hypothetical protein
VPKGSTYHFVVAKNSAARYAEVRSTPALEKKIARNGAADNWRG